MAAASRTKTADKQAVLKKLLPLLKKQYKVPNSLGERPVLETMIYAVCLENSSIADGGTAYQQLFVSFPDLNEARVSSVHELEAVFDGAEDAEWKAFRIRSILQYVFEKNFTFEFESLRKKTLELATKQLARIKHVTPFVRSFTLQATVGAHVLPLDDRLTHALVWLGLAPPGLTGDDLSESLKSVVRKAESDGFCLALRCLATDPELHPAFKAGFAAAPPEGYDPNTAYERLTELIKLGSTKYLEREAQKNGAAAKAEAKAAKPKATKAAKQVEAPPEEKPAPAAKKSATKEPKELKVAKEAKTVAEKKPAAKKKAAEAAPVKKAAKKSKS